MFTIFKKESDCEPEKFSSHKITSHENIDFEIEKTKAKILAIDKEIFLLDQYIQDIKSHHK
jgi:hypothetical protein